MKMSLFKRLLLLPPMDNFDVNHYSKWSKNIFGQIEVNKDVLLLPTKIISLKVGRYYAIVEMEPYMDVRLQGKLEH